MYIFDVRIRHTNKVSYILLHSDVNRFYNLRLMDWLIDLCLSVCLSVCLSADQSFNIFVIDPRTSWSLKRLIIIGYSPVLYLLTSDSEGHYVSYMYILSSMNVQNDVKFKATWLVTSFNECSEVNLNTQKFCRMLRSLFERPSKPATATYYHPWDRRPRLSGYQWRIRCLHRPIYIDHRPLIADTSCLSSCLWRHWL